MIFITTGTTHFPFHRMDTLVELLGKKIPEDIHYQNPATKLTSKTNVFIYQELSFFRFSNYIKKARVIVSHGGPATIFLALKHAANLPFILPRQHQFGEHVNDHQVDFCQFLKQQKVIYMTLAEHPAVTALNYSHSPEKNKTSQKSSVNLLIKKLDKLTLSD